MPCSNCGQQGHNRRTCSHHIIENSSTLSHHWYYTSIRYNTSNDENTASTPPRSSAIVTPNAPSRNHLYDTQLYESPTFHHLPTFSSLFDDDFDTPLKKTLVQCVTRPCHTTECAICMEPLQTVDTITTRCGHMYHGTCMFQHIKNNDSCPLCRGTLTN